MHLSTEVIPNISRKIALENTIDMFGVCSDSRSMQAEVKETIQEPIKVIASFNSLGKTVGIHFFNWRNRTYQVESVNLFHIEKDGNKKLYHFAVSAQGNSYELVFDPITLEWNLGSTVTA